MRLFFKFGCIFLHLEVYLKSIALMPDRFACLPWLGQKAPIDQGILNLWQHECLGSSQHKLGKPKKLPYWRDLLSHHKHAWKSNELDVSINTSAQSIVLVFRNNFLKHSGNAALIWRLDGQITLTDNFFNLSRQ